MLVNLTNHPFDGWEEDQKKAALKQYHEVMDIPFPQIDPKASLDYVIQLAKDYFERILSLKNQVLNDESAANKSYSPDHVRNPTPSFAVLLMGEWSFCFQLADMLRKENIPVLVTTTHRDVQMQNGQKISRFRFVQFRPYFKIS